jgi:hypothetical protein
MTTVCKNDIKNEVKYIKRGVDPTTKLHYFLLLFLSFLTIVTQKNNAIAIKRPSLIAKKE